MKFGTNTVNVLVGCRGRIANDGVRKVRKAKLGIDKVWRCLSIMLRTEFQYSGGYLRENGSIEKTDGVEKVRVLGSIGGAGQALSLIVEFVDDPGTMVYVNWKYHGIRNFACETPIRTGQSNFKGFIRDTQSVKGTRSVVKGIRSKTLKQGSPISIY